MRGSMAICVICLSYIYAKVTYDIDIDLLFTWCLFEPNAG